jgi:F-type H+-transporting ATPase subunit epsilon
MKVTILTPARTIYDGEAWSVFLPGTEGEFEIMDNHKPVMSLLREGQIVLDWEKTVQLKRGIVKMSHGEVMALIEE